MPYIYIYIYIRVHKCVRFLKSQNTLEDEVRLFIFVDGLCCPQIVLAHFVNPIRGLRIQLFNQLFVIPQSTARIFGVLH